MTEQEFEELAVEQDYDQILPQEKVSQVKVFSMIPWRHWKNL